MTAPARTPAGDPPPPFTQRATLILIVVFLAATAGCVLTVLAGHTVFEGLLVAGSAAGAAASLAHRFISP